MTADHAPPSYAALGRQLGLSPSAVARAEARALAKLAAHIAEQAALLQYNSIDAYLASGDDRVAKIIRWEGETAIVQAYRPKPAADHFVDPNK